MMKKLLFQPITVGLVVWGEGRKKMASANGSLHGSGDKGPLRRQIHK